jgi:hypothetical protein
MVSQFLRATAVTVALVLAATSARAQTIQLGSGGAEQIWRGTETGALAGMNLDQGAVSAGDGRRDLIIGAPGGPGVAGRVYVLFGGPVRTGELSLADADVRLTAGVAADRFGASTASGNIWNVEGATPRALVVGAPGAASGAGRVYLFRGGFSLNTSVNASAALLEIRGLPGDRLGESLATADLNGDGYREIVIGAPGNNRVYVVNGGASLNHGGPAVVRTLATQPADLTITGSSIGSMVAAGDVTDDGRSDVLISGDNRVFLLKARAGLPATIDLSSAPSADLGVLLGINVGDLAGTSIRIGDFDADGARDLAISAPGGDGPGETRPDAGETYVVWGGNVLVQSLWPGGVPAGRSFSTADATFYGAASQDLLAYALTSGDINRDNPDDLVIVAPNANGAGIAYVYYGRSRNSFGVLQPNGRRTIDFSDASQASRMILGNVAEGDMVASTVFEVTGEGARDLVIGTPTSDGHTGGVHFTISPRLQLSQQSVSVHLVVNAGQSFAREVRIKNASPVPITWDVLPQSTWLNANPRVGSAVAGGDGVFNVIASASGLSPGNYTGRVTVRSTSEHLEMSLSVDVTITVAPAVRSDGDFSGDGTLDLVWQHNTQGWLSLWRMNGTTLVGGASMTPGQVTDNNWKVVGTGDFNGDQHPDLLWHHATEGWVAVWLMNGTTLVSSAYTTPNRLADTNWKIAATGDFNRDGRRDIVWQHQTTGSIAVWMMDGLTMTSGVFMTPSQVTDTNWKIVGAADFNGDDQLDLLWQHRTQGYVAIWVMNGTSLVSGHILNQVTDNGWQIRGVGDLNVDGHPDVLWQHTNGTVAVWFTNGLGFVGGTLLNPSTVTAGWTMMGPR